MTVFSFVLIPLFVLVTFIVIIISLFEYILFKTKFSYLGNYYPLILFKERKIIKTSNELRKKKILHEYDIKNKVFIIKDDNDDV